MTLRALLAKDLRREGRAKEGLAAGLVVVALFMVLDLWIFTDLADQPRAAAAVLWTPIVFGAAAVTGRGMAMEFDRGTMEWLRSLPVDHGAHGLSRTVVDALLLVILAAATLLLAALLFGTPLSWPLVIIFLLGLLGLAIVGSLAGALAGQATAREVMLPIAIVPVAAPLLLSGVKATLAVLAGGSWGDITAPLLLMLGYDLVAAGVAAFLWPILLEGD